VRKILHNRPTPAMIVACLALFVALGSGTYAAVKLKPNSVKTKNIKDGAVKTSKIADGAVTNAKLAADAKGGGAAAGGGITTVTTRIVSASLGPTGTFSGVDLTSDCQAGEKAVGGGGLINNDDNEVTYQASHPSPNSNGTTPTGWTVRFQITGIAHTVTTYAVCAR
jgi:hypothetical protein